MRSDSWVLLEVLSDGTIRPRSKWDRGKIEKKVGRAKPEANGAKLLRASLANIRSLPQLRLYWPWIRKVTENSAVNLSEKLLHNMLLVACGYTEPFVDIEGNMQLIPSSIAFDEMSDEDFSQYFERAQQIVAERILPGVSLKQLMNEARDECSFPEAA
jgi:hypothetical protein